MLKLEDLQVDTHVASIEPSAPVKLLYITTSVVEENATTSKFKNADLEVE